MSPDKIVISIYNNGEMVDLPTIMPLIKAAYMEEEGRNAVLPNRYEQQLREALQSQNNLRIIVASIKEKAVGLSFCFLHPEPAIGGRTLELQDLVVLPSWRGKGIGTRLMAETEAVAAREGCKKIILSVSVDNPIGQRLSRKLGYGHCHPPKYYMEKPLNDSLPQQAG
jgi:GNAT superfamily N-acetyltransferase